MALERLRQEGVNLVSWRRKLPAGLEASLAAWATRFPAQFDEVVPVSALDLMETTCELAEPARSWILKDVRRLVTKFAKLAAADRVRLSFGVIRSDRCRKFHVDFLRYRLVTTYLGPGTEWVHDEAVCREALEHPEGCPCDKNPEIVRDLSAIRHAALGEVLVMKGELHEHGRGAVHRSPPIEEAGLVRVVLVVSTAGEHP